MGRDETHETVSVTLAAHALGVLPKRLADHAEAHVAECPRCRHELAGYTAAARQARRLRPDLKLLAGEG